MKPSPHSTKAANAFTLIELLVVIAIIAILIGLLFPAFAAVREQAKKVAAHNDETQIVAAVKAYYVEYGKYPVSTSSGTATDTYFGSATTPPSGSVAYTNDLLFDVLRNNTGNATNSSAVVSLNPRGISFLDVPPVKSAGQPVSGVVSNTATSSATSKVGAWYDPWGSQYNVLIDSSYDGVLNNPYTDTPGGITLSTGVIVWAYGKNGALGGGAPAAGNFSSEPGTAKNFTGSGDVISWQ
jgi:prepilin-type N-terminal cleavage/methylation domain-containing protein